MNVNILQRCLLYLPLLLLLHVCVDVTVFDDIVDEEMWDATEAHSIELLLVAVG